VDDVYSNRWKVQVVVSGKPNAAQNPVYLYTD
jgi:hypothetical protein